MPGFSMLQPLLLTLLGAAGTGLGGLLVVLQPSMDFRRLGALQGLAAGLMLSISLIDLLPEAAEEIGFLPAQLCFYAGVAFFAAIVTFIPEPDAQTFAATSTAAAAAAAAPAEKGSSTSGSSTLAAAAPAGVSTAVLPPALAAAGAAAGMRRRGSSSQVPATGTPTEASCVTPARLDVSPSKPAVANGWQRQQQQQQQQQQLLLPALQPPPLVPISPVGSPGSPTDLQVELKSPACGSSNGGKGTATACGGEAGSRGPHSSSSSSSRAAGAESERRHRQQLLMSGLITAVGIALHNFPEGIAVFLASQKSVAVGVSLACAIALHNIPEGVAVALPVYFATGSRWRGLQTAVLSGLAEPLAVLLLGGAFPVLCLNKHVVDGMLAGVGGIMAYLAVYELLPLALQHAGRPLAVGCLFAGMCTMSVTLHVLNTHVLAGLH